MRKLVLALLLAGIGLSQAGCGGGLSEAQMRGRSRKRPPEDEPPPAAQVAAAKDAAANAASAPAASIPPAPPSAAAAEPAEGVAASATSGPPSPPVPPNASAPGPIAAAQPTKQAVPVARPAQPLTTPECRTRSVENLKRIGEALSSYAQRTKSLPKSAMTDAEDRRLLSWRVAILPDLGYQDLYQQFRFDQPWDSPHNKQLLPLIPAEYTSPERFDEKTNYLGLAAVDHAFPLTRAVSVADIKDGLQNTVVVMEVDDSGAVPWTKPADWAPLLDEPRGGCTTLRSDGIFALLGDGRVVSLGLHLADKDLSALFTIAGGESPAIAASLVEPTNPRPLAAAPAPAPDSAVSTTPPPASETVAQAAVAVAAEERPSTERLSDAPSPLPPLPTNIVLPGESAEPIIEPGTLAVPAAVELEKARALIREVYGEQYEAAKSLEERQQFAQFLLNESKEVDENPAQYYEVLRITRDLAITCGDAATALQADERLSARFRLDGAAARLKTLEDLGKHPRAAEHAALRTEELSKLFREAFAADRYDEANRACEILLEVCRSQRDGASAKRLQDELKSLALARAAYADAVPAVQALRADPQDAAANATLGRFLCFVKNQWQAGLPYLARSSDIKLRVLATIDLEQARSPQEAFSLAEQYWELAEEQKQPFARGLELRATWHYQSAIDRMLGGLEKVKAQRRIADARQRYGDDEIERLLAPLKPDRLAEEE